MKRRSSTKAPPDPEFFIDRDLGNGVTARLKEAGFIVHDHDEHFKDDRTKDIEWLPLVAKRGWVALSSNKTMRYNELEVACIMRCGARVIFPSGNVRHLDFAELLIRTRHRLFKYIHKQARRSPGPYLARVRRDAKLLDEAPGTVDTWLDKKKWTDMQTKGKSPRRKS